MASKVFAAIDVGSNELSMKVYEITPKKGAREIDYVNSTVELGSDTYNSGRITEDSIMKVCEILNKFRRKMREYDVREYKAYASSAVREAENPSERRAVIAHCNCPDRAEYVKNELMKRATFKEIVITETAGVATVYAGDGGIVLAVV